MQDVHENAVGHDAALIVGALEDRLIAQPFAAAVARGVCYLLEPCLVAALPVAVWIIVLSIGGAGGEEEEQEEKDRPTPHPPYKGGSGYLEKRCHFKFHRSCC